MILNMSIFLYNMILHVVKSVCQQVRRCAMATLGELLFYIATQNEGSPRSGGGHDNSAKDVKSSVWQVCTRDMSISYTVYCCCVIVGTISLGF